MYGNYKGLTDVNRRIRHGEKPSPYDMPNLRSLPLGQRRAMEALIGGGVARTYSEAASVAGMSEGTLLTHVNRVRKRHPRLYRRIRLIRLAQLAERHEEALAAARAHSAIYFRKQAQWMRSWM